MGIQSILDRKGAGVITVRATEAVKSAADRMRARSIAALVVTSGDAIAGLISERDIVHAVSAHGERALAMEVRDVAPQTTVTVAPGDTLKRAMSLMTSHHWPLTPKPPSGVSKISTNSFLAGSGGSFIAPRTTSVTLLIMAAF